MPDERGGATGAQALARLLPTRIRSGAGRRRTARAHHDLALNLGANGTRSGSNAGRSARPDAVRSARSFRLAGAQRLLALRPAILPLAAAGNALEADAVEALALLDGGIASDGADALLRRPDPRVRAAAVRHLEGPSAGPRLAALVRSDPAASVRAAAATALLERGAPGAEDDATPALFDLDPTVRAAA